MKRILCSGEFILSLPLQTAITFFTPEGERAWVPGWDPQYPSGEASDLPGTVFITAHHGVRTTWVVVARSEGAISYARIAHGKTAGLISVTCRQNSLADSTSVNVVYDLTALTPDAEAHLQEFQEGYEAYLESWRNAITTDPLRP